MSRINNIIASQEKEVFDTFEKGDNPDKSGIPSSEKLSFLHDMAIIDKDLGANDPNAADEVKNAAIGTRELMKDETKYYRMAVQILYRPKDGAGNEQMVQLYGKSVEGVERLSNDIKAWYIKKYNEKVFSEGLKLAVNGAELWAGQPRKDVFK